MFGFLSKLVKTITLKHVGLWLLTGVLIILGYTAYEHRAELFQSATHLTGNDTPSVNLVGATFKVSEATKEKVKDFVASNKDFVAMGISAADLRLNQRTTIYFFSLEAGNGSPQVTRNLDRLAFFTNDDENNRQMIKMINGEFHCVPYANTILAKSRPEINRNVSSICRASLPPYYGHFAGFITLYTKHDPSVDQLVELKNSMETFATEIYFKDVIPTTRKSE